MTTKRGRKPKSETEVRETNDETIEEQEQITQSQKKQPDDCEWLPRKAHFRVDEVARYFGVTEQTIKTWIAHNHFPGTIKIGGPYRIPREAIISCRFKHMLTKQSI